MGLPIRVLLVEDDPDAAKLTRVLLTQNQDEMFWVEWKNSILNAVSRLAEPGVDVVLLDLGMPELVGCEAHLAISSVVRKTIPVVILTGDDSTVTQEVTKSQGAAKYLIKQRTSSVELRRAVYEAVVPAMNTKPSFG